MLGRPRTLSADQNYARALCASTEMPQKVVSERRGVNRVPQLQKEDDDEEEEEENRASDLLRVGTSTEICYHAVQASSASSSCRGLPGKFNLR